MSSTTGFEVAIIGMGGRFPGSKNIDELWKNLCDGKELISHFTDEELRAAGVPNGHIEDSSYVKSRGIIEDVDKFDAGLFGLYPKEVEMLDPQHRLFLECSWEAMEDAGYCPDGYIGTSGVFGGVGMNSYALQFLKSQSDLKVSAEAYQLSIGNDKDFLTTRVSYKLNLTGPSLDIQTACSTSLIATHVACMNLINYQCDLAIAGGATISLPQVNGYHYQEGMILSPDGHCRPFDFNAKGTVPSSGVGIVILKRLEDALNDKDSIYAVIKGSAYNNDGAVKVGYTAPGVEGQKNVVLSAYAMAEMKMDEIGYIETHGTGTGMGDPIEIDALTQAFSAESEKKQFCAIGSIKSNLGHMDTAAGIGGLIKAVLSIHHGKILPSINYENSNEKINFSDTPFYVNTELKEWSCDNLLRTAGVSSFGIGGTNAHVVLQQAPKRIPTVLSNSQNIFPFAAKSRKSLSDIKTETLKYIKKQENISLDNIAYTLQVGRKHLEQRSYVLAKDINELKNKLINVSNNSSKNIIVENPSVVFMFSGQGSQYINMGNDLYNNNQIFKKHSDNCYELINAYLDINLKELIYPTQDNHEVTSDLLKQTKYTQPSLFVIEYAIAMTMIEYGIYPSYMAGHSIGEYVAACLAGVMKLEDAIKLVCKRAELMQSLEKGSMLSVNLSEVNIKEILPNELDLAVINAPELCVVSGGINEISRFENLLINRKISCTKLRTSHAFHSRMMEPILSKFKEVFNSIILSEPSIPYLSNLTGTLITKEQAQDPNYYANHLRYTVRFAENIDELLKNKSNVFIELGPGTTLTSLSKLNPNANNRIIVSSMKLKNQKLNDEVALFDSIGKLWVCGIDLKWEKFHTTKPYRIHLPTYVFDKKSYLLKTNKNNNNFPIKNQNGYYLYENSWQRISKINKEVSENSSWIVFENKEQLFTKNIIKSNEVVSVILDDHFEIINDRKVIINKDDVLDYQKLFNHCEKNDIHIENIIHLFYNGYKSNEDLNSVPDSFLSLINLVKSLELLKNDRINISLLTDEIFDVYGHEKCDIKTSSIIGLAQVIQQEYPFVKTKIIDASLSEYNSSNLKTLLNNIKLSSHNTIVALRGKHIWQKKYYEIENDVELGDSLIKKNGTYLISGGLGRIGLVFANYLIEKYEANIIFIDQYKLPEQENWNENINDINISDRIKSKIKYLQNSNNSIISSYKVDIKNSEELKNISNEIKRKGIKINGIIHAAGIVGEKTVQLINQFSTENFIEQSNVKLVGLKNLYDVFSEFKLDFVFVQSSISAILGGYGFASYSAINNIIDSYVENKIRLNLDSSKWINTNWDAWSFDDNNKFITPKLGVDILDKLLRTHTPNNIIVSVDELHERIRKLNIETDQNNENENTENVNHERPELDCEYIEPKNDLQKQIQNEWMSLLGINKIGINDNFFELGGNSLIGTQLVSSMRKKFNVDIPLVAVFENATIKGIANLINENKIDENESNKLNEVMDLINSMEESEVEKILKSKDSNE